MPLSKGLSAGLEKLTKEIEQYQQRAKKLSPKDARYPALYQQWNALKALHKKVKDVLEEQQAPEEQWLDLVEGSKLPAPIKQQLKDLLLPHNDQGTANKQLVNLVINFYTQRYTNSKKHLDKLDLGAGMTEEQYHSYLQQAIQHTLKTKGIKTSQQHLAVNLVLILRGRLKATGEAPGEMQINISDRTVQGAPRQFEIGWSSPPKTLEWPQKLLNKLPIFNKQPFYIDGSEASITIKGVVSIAEDKLLEVDTSKLGEVLVGGFEALPRSFGPNISETSLDTEVAAGEFKLSLEVMGIPMEGSVKIANMVSSTNLLAEFTPVEFSFKGTVDLDRLRQLIPNTKALDHFLHVKLEIAIEITTSLGVSVAEEVSKRVDDATKKYLQQQQQLIDGKYGDYMKKQEAFGELLEQKNHMHALQEERKELAKKIAQEKNPKKKKQLLAKKGRRYIELLKEHKAFQKRLQEQGVGTLQGLSEHLNQQHQQPDTAFKKIEQKKNKVILELTESLDKTATKLLLRNKNKLLLRGVTKLVPGLNIISTAMDIYDAYTLVRDLYESYEKAQEDLQLQLDAEIEAALNAQVDPTTLSERVTTFFGYLGAGGKMTLLTQPEADELTVFFEYEFKSEEEFEKFVWAYADYFEVTGECLENNKELINNLRQYKLEHNSTLVSKEGQHIDANKINRKQSRSSQFFHNAMYKIVEGDPTKIGSVITVDASGIDVNKKGEQVQVSFPNDDLLYLKVIQHLGDREYKLKPADEEDYAIKIEGFKTYILNGNSVFIYKEAKDTIHIRTKK